MPILLGGRVFHHTPELADTLDADGWCVDGESALHVARFGARAGGVRARRLAVVCDLHGRIRRTVRNDVGADIIEYVTVLPALGAPDRVSVIFEMLEAVRTHHAIYGWLVEVRTRRLPGALHFAG